MDLQLRNCIAIDHLHARGPLQEPRDATTFCIASGFVQLPKGEVHSIRGQDGEYSLLRPTLTESSDVDYPWPFWSSHALLDGYVRSFFFPEEI